MDEQDSEKRAIKMTEKAVEDHKTRQLQARRYKLSQLTSMVKQIEQLMEDDANADTVKNKLRVEFSRLHQELADLNSGLERFMTEEEFLDNQKNWFEPKNKSMNDFFWKCEGWMKEVMKRSEQAEECDRQVTHADSRSTSSKTTTKRLSRPGSQCGSVLSSSSSVRIKTELERASLKAKAAALKEKLAIEREEAEWLAEKRCREAQLQAEEKRREAEFEAEQKRIEVAIKARKEMYAMQTALAELDAKMEVLQKYENTQADRSSIGADEQASEKEVKTAIQPPPQLASPAPSIKANVQTAAPQRVLLTPKMEFNDGPAPDSSVPQRASSASKMEITSGPVLDSLCQTITQQANVTEYLVRNHKASLLPDLTIPTFKGDPLEYKSFIRSVEHGIEGRTGDNRDRLQFLLQYTSGQPHELVKSCIHMEPSAGYAKAKQMLKEFFGDDYLIAEAYIKEALDWPTIKPEDGAALQSFALFLTGCSNTMTDISYMEDLDNTANIKALTNKLPYKLKETWRKYACDLQEQTKKRARLKDFVNFVNKQVKYMLHPLYGNLKETSTSTKDPVRQKPKLQYAETFKPKKVFTTAVVPLRTENKVKTENDKQAISKTQPVSVDANNKPCVYCKGEQHSLTACRKLRSKPHKEKIDFLRSKGLCFACLKHGHMSSSCREKVQCQDCSRLHPTLLHMNTKDSQEEAAKDSREQQSVSSALVQTKETFGVTGAGKEDCVLSIVPVCVKAQKGTKTVMTYAFLDPGSSTTFATESLIHLLNMNGRNTSISLRTMGNVSIVNTCIVTGLEISSLDGDEFIELSEVYSQKAIPVTKDNIPRQEDVNSWPHLKDVKLPTIQAEVGLLIGANVPKAMEPLQVISSVDDGPYAVRTILGWTVNGPLRGGMETNNSKEVTANRISVAKLDELWQLQFKQDFPDAGQNEDIEMSKDDHQFIHVVSQSSKLVDGHYSVCLPVRNKALCMPNNRSVAEQRALNLRKRFSKDVKFHAEYVAFMDDILKKGYAVELDSAEQEPTEGRTWYLPHHGVRHPVKQKLRVVFDCGASFGGTSLNQQLLQGPDLTSSLVGVLMRFRQETVAVMADVEGMFHQVRVSDEDTDLLRFLWWPDGNYEQELVEYKMLVHIFGATSSPSVATFALQKCATDFVEEFGEEAANTVKKNFYVDDCLKSTSDEDTATTLCANLRSMLAKGGFRLTKWSSNSRKLLNSIPEEERAQGFQDLDLDEHNLPMERALGIHWCVESDQFKFKVNLKDRPHTRRGLLSLVSSIFDPLGFLAPVILPAKRIMQDLCRLKYSWDEDLPDNVINSWKRWISGLQQLEKFGVNRCVKTKQFGASVFAQLHHFADTSEDAYGTTSYLLLRSATGEAQSTLIMAKARVTPLKSPTIPRMELTAATVAIKMDKLLKKELELELDESIFWTDSTAVLKYLNSESTRFKTFVANRISTILEHSQTSQWRYINTTLNPADHVSRGQTVEAFLNNESWLSGPSFLLCPQDQWPKNPDPGMADINDPEVKRVAQAHVIQVQEPKGAVDQLMIHYSAWMKLKRAVAWFLRLKDLLKELKAKRKEQNTSNEEDRMNQFKKSYKGTHLTCEDLTKAETEIVKYFQKQGFKEDLATLKERRRVKKSSSLHRLNPGLQDGVIRVGGRLSRAAMPDDSKQQAILPKDSHITKLVLRHIHDVTAHAGRNHMLAQLRQRFWIPGASGAIRNFLSKCVICKKLHGTAGKQLMADLPKCRVLPDDPPFTRVGVDYFGPFLVKRGRGQIKRYGVIFTCLAIRAIHLEVAASLDTDACLNAIRRFLARRGQVKEMYSDNGTNFRSADHELKKSIKEWNTSKIAKDLQQTGVQWHFNPPTGSHHGGSWERLIRSVRKILNVTVREQLLDEEGLHTLLCEAEAVINGRPITKASSDLNDLEALTPNHLLLLKVKPELPPGVFNKDDQYANRRWRQVQYLADIFWKRWCQEYLTQLQERQRWSTPGRNFCVGDVVLIVDDTSPRNSWPLGRIVETLPDKNGLVRQVKVKTKTNELCRPITKLCLLQESEDN